MRYGWRHTFKKKMHKNKCEKWAILQKNKTKNNLLLWQSVNTIELLTYLKTHEFKLSIQIPGRIRSYWLQLCVDTTFSDFLYPCQRDLTMILSQWVTLRKHKKWSEFSIYIHSAVCFRNGFEPIKFRKHKMSTFSKNKYRN